MWTIALKTVLYHKWRSLIAIAGGAIGICLVMNLVIFGSQMDAALDQEMRSRYGSVDMMVGYRHVDQYMDRSTVQQIAELTEVEAHSQAFVGSVMFDHSPSYQQLTGIYYVGVDHHWLAKETYGFQADLADGEVVLTTALAERLGVDAGQVAEIPFPNGQTYSWTVRERIPDRIGSPDMAIFHLPSFQHQLGKEHQVNLLMLKLQPNVDKEWFTANRLRRISSTITVDALDELAAQRKNIDTMRIFGVLLGFLAMVAGALFVYASLQISFQQRKRVLASLRILGGDNEQLRTLIGLETVLISLFSALLGFGAGIGLSQLLSDAVQAALQIELLETWYNWPLLILICCICTLFIAAVAMIPAWRISKVSPMLAMREDHEANASVHPWHKIIALTLFLAGSLMCLIALFTSIIPSGFSILWGFLLAAAVYAGIGVISKPLYTWGAALLYRFKARTACLALKQAVNDQRKSVMTIAVIALSITIYLPLAAILHTIENNMEQSIQKVYVTDLLVTSRYHNVSKLPRQIDDEIKSLAGVKQAVAISTHQAGRLMGYDFTKASADWLKERQGDFQYGRHVFPRRELISYYITDLAAMEEIGLIPPLSVEPEAAVIFQKNHADDLGIQLGDHLKISKEGKEDSDVTELVVVGILENLPGIEWVSDVFVDWTNPLLVEKDNVFRLLVQTTNLQETERGLIELRPAYPELEWDTKAQAHAEMRLQGGQRQFIIWSVIGVLLLTGCLGLMNTLSAFLYAKKREFAVLRMIHLTPRQLRHVIFIQCFSFGCSAIVTGLFSAYCLIWSLNAATEETFTVPWVNLLAILLIILLTILLISFVMSLLFGRMNLHKAVSVEG